MLIRTLLAICFLATSLVSAERPSKVRSKISDEGLSAIFGEGDNRGSEVRKEDCTSLAQSISRPNNESLRSQLEGANQRFCRRTLGADCEAGGGGLEARNGNNDGGGLQRRRNHKGGRNKDGNRGEEEDDDQDEPSSTSFNQPPKNVPTQAQLETPTPPTNPGVRAAHTKTKVCALAPTPTNSPIALCPSPPPPLTNLLG